MYSLLRSSICLIILQNLPFAKVRHQVSTVDVQPSISEKAILVSVTGYLFVCWFLVSPHCYPSLLRQVDDGPNPLSFSQVFQLVSDNGTYYVYVSWFNY